MNNAPNMPLSKIRWYGQRFASQVNHLHITVITGIALLLIVQWLGIMPRTTQLIQIQAQLPLLSAKLAVASQLADTAPLKAKPTQPMLPDIRTLNAHVKQLHQLASQLHVPLTQVQYSLTREGSVWRYDIHSEQDVPYASARQFVLSAMQQHPNLALQTLQVERDNAQQALPHVRLQLSLYMADTPEHNQ